MKEGLRRHRKRASAHAVMEASRELKAGSCRWWGGRGGL